MAYIQIGLIHTDNLPQDQKKWVEAQLQEEKHQHLVYIFDGDASLIREIDTRAESPELVVSRIQPDDDRAVTVTLIDEDYNKEVLDLFRSIMIDGDKEEKGYWSGSINFRFVE